MNDDIDVEIQAVPDSWMSLSNKKKTFYNYWETFMDFCVIYPIAAIISYLFTGNRGDAYGLYLLLPALLYITGARIKIKRNYIYIICQIPLFIIAYYFSSSLNIQVISFFFLIIACSASIHKRLKTVTAYRRYSNFISCEMILLIEYNISIAAGYTFIERIIIYHTIIYSLSILIYIHLSRTEKLMEWETNLSKRDLNNLKSSSRKVIESLFVPFIFAFAAVIYEEFKGYGKNFLLYLTGILSSYFKGNSRFQYNNSTSKMPAMEDVKEEFKINSKTGKESVLFKWLGITGKYLIYFILFLAVIVLLKAIFEVIYGFLSGKKRISTDRRESIFNVGGIAENIAGVLYTLKRKVISSFGNARSIRIRKIYKNLVERTCDSGKTIQKSSTPHMIEKDVEENAGIDISKVTEIYEKARYGKHDCTEEDVKKIKSYIRDFDFFNQKGKHRTY